jgi:hypothetical protein
MMREGSRARHGRVSPPSGQTVLAEFSRLPASLAYGASFTSPIPSTERRAGAVQLLSSSKAKLRVEMAQVAGSFSGKPGGGSSLDEA